MNKQIESPLSNNIQQESVYITTPQQSPELPAYEFSWTGYAKAISILFFILALLIICMLLLKRKGSLFAFATMSKYFVTTKNKKKSSLPLTVIQRYTIDQRKSLLVVQFLNKTLLLGVTDASIQVLEESLEKGSSTHENNVAIFNAHLESLGETHTD